MNRDRLGSRDRLGRGLGSLLEAYLSPEAIDDSASYVSVRAISPNPMQPRRHFKKEDLEELKASIGEHGLIQPLVVRRKPGNEDQFQLIAGERRFRAVSALGWLEVPVVIRQASDDTLLVLALVENLHREALNPLEEAEGYHTLATRFGLSQEEIASNVGKSRPTVANSLRLLKSPPAIKEHVRNGRLSMGHARALLAVPDAAKATELAEEAVAQGWSVRETERRARTRQDQRVEPRGKGRLPPMFQIFEDLLADHLAARVTIQHRSGERGAVRIAYSNLRELEGLVEAVTGRKMESIAD